MVINAVSFDYIISNVKSQIAFLKYRTVRQQKRYYTFNPFFCCTGDISKMSLWSAFTKIVAAFITQFVDVPRTWQTCRSLARLCVHFHPSLKKNVCIPLRTCVRQKEITSVGSCWTRWELDESLISLRTEWSKWRVRIHTFLPSDENVTLFFVRGDIFAHGTWNPHF